MGSWLRRLARRLHRRPRPIYLGAFLPQDGESALDLAQTDKGSSLGPALEIDAPGGVARVAKDQFAGIFCADCGEEALALLAEKYLDEPLAPLAEKVALTGAGFGSVPKYYIRTGLDHAISPDLQDQMAAKVTLAGTATLKTSHSPFLSAPADLVSTLADLGKR